MKYTADKDAIKAYAKEGYAGRGVFSPKLFIRDMNTIMTTKKMITRFLSSGALNDKLMINNVILTLNSFGIQKTNVIFRMTCPDAQFGVVKAILMFLRSYRAEVGSNIEPNRIMVDILKDTATRYNLEHL